MRVDGVAICHRRRGGFSAHVFVVSVACTAHSIEPSGIVGGRRSLRAPRTHKNKTIASRRPDNCQSLCADGGELMLLSNIRTPGHFEGTTLEGLLIRAVPSRVTQRGPMSRPARKHSRQSPHFIRSRLVSAAFMATSHLSALANVIDEGYRRRTFHVNGDG